MNAKPTIEAADIPVYSDIEWMILAGVRLLRPEHQAKVLTYIQSLLQEEGARYSLEEMIDEITSRIPPEAWDNVPEDGAEQHDHYLYGSPKR